MKEGNQYYTVYEQLESPPIETPEYKEVKDKFTELNSVNSGDIFIPDDVKIQYLDNPFNKSLVNDQLQTDDSNQIQWQSNQNSTKTTKNDIIDYFVNKGLTENQARGIYGNLMQESGGNLTIKSRDGYNSYGLAQWTGARKTKLFQMYGKNPSKQNQLDYLWWELNNTEKPALRALLQTTTVQDATKVFMDKFERPSKSYANYARRLKFALS